jgi:CheY-like chemotaxis protein
MEKHESDARLFDVLKETPIKEIDLADVLMQLRIEDISGPDDPDTLAASEETDAASDAEIDDRSGGADRSDDSSLQDMPPEFSDSGEDGLPPSGFEIVSSKTAFARPDNNRDSSDKDNRRRSERTRLAIPVRVKGHDQNEGEWTERTETIDASRTGVTLRLGRRLQHGKVLRLSLSLPDELRSQGQSEVEPETYAIVRRIESVSNGARVIGLEFLGDRPPKGYFERPWASFQIKRSPGFDRRRRPREAARDVIWIEYLDESIQPITRETTRTEDISSGGMRVSVKTPPPEFEMVRVSYANLAFESHAVVCNRFTGSDGLERLCLQFLDKKWYTEQALAEGKRSADCEPGKGERRRRILLADDDPPLRKVIGKILAQAGYEVITVEDGLSAVEWTMKVRPDLVITDVLMPKMNGFQVCKAIKELSPAPKVILLSGIYSKPSYRHQARKEYGADDLLPKPFEVSALLARIKHYIYGTELSPNA